MPSERGKLSVNQTFGRRNELPTLPIPSLQETCEKYLKWLRPIRSEGELERSKKAVADFLRPGGSGERLQTRLQQWAKDRPSWLEPFWEDMYLSTRSPVTIHVNPYFIFEDDEQTPKPTPLTRAARLIRAAVSFKEAVDGGSYPAEEDVKGTPLCMQQFERFFSTTRIPGPGRDHLRQPYSSERPGPSSERHILVSRRGHFFVLEVIDELDLPRSARAIEKDLKTIVRRSDEAETRADSIALLTSLARDDWAEARNHLRELCPSNARSLERVESALFAVGIEVRQAEDLAHAGRLFFHGDGSNIWFDKAYTIMVCPDGRAGMNLEHTGLDGSTFLSFMDYLYQKASSDWTEEKEGDSQAEAPVTELVFELDAKLQALLGTARERFDALVADTTIRLFVFDAFGTDTIKSLKVSPDGFAQLAFHLAQYWVFGSCRTTYESAMTRGFLHGRTETIRTVTDEVVAFCEAMNDPNASPERRCTALRQAAETHVARAKECRLGRGVERHLFGLQHIWKRFGTELDLPVEPRIFTEGSWAALRHDGLSTSNLSSPVITFFGFGPTTDRCIGIGYVMRPKELHFALSSWTSMATELATFEEKLAGAFLEMKELLQRG
jgi:carnitine O-acetyltransferase